MAQWTTGRYCTYTSRVEMQTFAQGESRTSQVKSILGVAVDLY